MLTCIKEMDIETFKMRQNEIVMILGAFDMEWTRYPIQIPLINLSVHYIRALYQRFDISGFRVVTI